MKALIGAMIVVVTAGFAIAQVDYVPLLKPKLGVKVGISQKDFDAIKAGLEKNAAALIDGTIPDRECLNTLHDVQYDKATWAIVEAYLNKLPKSLPKVTKDGKAVTVTLEKYHRLYLICRLTEPLQVSKPDVILDAFKTVDSLEKTYCLSSKLSAYMNYPPCSFLGACKLPSPPASGGPPQTDAFTKMDQARQRKSTAEQPAILTNQYIGEFENIYCRVLAFAGDANKDKALFDWIVKNESGEKNYIWKMGVEALVTEAASGDMSKERAAKLYDSFLQYGKRRFKPNEIQWVAKSHYQDTKDRELTAEWVYRWYIVRCLPQPSLDEITPDFTVRWDYPSYPLLTAAKYMDMVVKGIKDPTDKKLLLVRNPSKADSEKAKPEERKWKADPERWIRENTLHEKPKMDTKEFKE